MNYYKIQPSRTRYYITLRDALKPLDVIEIDGDWLAVEADEGIFGRWKLELLNEIIPNYDRKAKCGITKDVLDLRDIQQALEKKPKTEWREAI